MSRNEMQKEFSKRMKVDAEKRNVDNKKEVSKKILAHKYGGLRTKPEEKGDTRDDR